MKDCSGGADQEVSITEAVCNQQSLLSYQYKEENRSLDRWPGVERRGVQGQPLPTKVERWECVTSHLPPPKPTLHSSSQPFTAVTLVNQVTHCPLGIVVPTESHFSGFPS